MSPPRGIAGMWAWKAISRTPNQGRESTTVGALALSHTHLPATY